MITVITFDLDDTLWDLRPVLLRAEQVTWDWLCERHPPLRRQFDVVRLRELKAQLVSRQPELANQISQQRILCIEVALQQSACPAPRARELARLAFEVFLHARHEVAFFEDALAVLATLSRNHTLGALTNGNADVERLGLARYFDFALAGEHFPAGKPAPHLFLAAMERTGATADQMVHVGDHIENDVRAAQRLGIPGIWVNLQGQSWPGPDQPAGEIRKLAELPDCIDRLGRTPHQPTGADRP